MFGMYSHVQDMSTRDNFAVPFGHLEQARETIIVTVYQPNLVEWEQGFKRRKPDDLRKNCDEEYVDETVTAHLLKTAEEAVRAGVQVDVRIYAAA